MKQRSLLALLLLHCNEVVSTDRLIDAMWAGTPPATARQSLHNFVAALRRTLLNGCDAPVLHTCDPGYRLDVRPGELDLERFRQLVDDARRALDSHDAATAARCLRRSTHASGRCPMRRRQAPCGIDTRRHRRR